MQVEFISAEAAIYEFKRATGIDCDFSKSDIIVFTNDVLDRIVTAEQYQHKVFLLPVEQYKVRLPEGFANVCQVAYREVCPPKYKTRAEIAQITQNILGSECNLKIDIECPKCQEYECNCSTAIVTVDADRIYSSFDPGAYSRYMNHFYKSVSMGNNDNRSPYHGDFKLIRKTTSSFFNVPYHISECVNFNLDCNIEYTIDKPNMILNVKEGEVLLSCMCKRVDENGFAMIPNDPTVIKAVAYALAERYMYRKYMETLEENRFKAWQVHIGLMEKWISRASERLRTPEFDDLHSFVTGFLHRIVPKYNYWEDLMRRRGDNFLAPGETYNLKGYRQR